MVSKEQVERLITLAERLRDEKLPYRTGYRRFRTTMLIWETVILVRTCYAIDRFCRMFGGAYVV